MRTTKIVEVSYCTQCPFYHEDYSGIDHRAECWLDIDVMPKRKEIPFQCPMKTKGIVVRLKKAHAKYEGRPEHESTGWEPEKL